MEQQAPLSAPMNFDQQMPRLFWAALIVVTINLILFAILQLTRSEGPVPIAMEETEIVMDAGSAYDKPSPVGNSELTQALSPVAQVSQPMLVTPVLTQPEPVIEPVMAAMGTQLQLPRTTPVAASWESVPPTTSRRTASASELNLPRRTQTAMPGTQLDLPRRTTPAMLVVMPQR